LQRAFTNILAADLPQTVGFYEHLLGRTRHFDSDWFVILTHPVLPDLETGVLGRDHAVVPSGIATAPGGVMLTFVVDDCDRVFAQAQQIGAAIIQPPTDMPYGQCRLVLRDADGTVIDISAPISPTA
jgi:predicted enzyme related to lactoylglutathione lyase